MRLVSLAVLARRSNVVNIILVGNTFIWYFIALLFLQDIVKNNSLIWVAHFSALILSAVAGAASAKQTERSRFLILWMTMGVIASVILSALSPSLPEILVGFVSVFLGFSIGFGMPACMSYFADSVPTENRGRISGIIMFYSGIGIIAFGSAKISDPLFAGIILAAWRLSSLLVFLWAKDYRNIKRKEEVCSYKQLLSQRSFILYLVPWIMFSLVNYLAVPMIPTNSGAEYSNLVQTAFMGGAAVLGGFVVDLVGRKRIAIAGFAMLGLGTATVGFFGSNSYVLYFNAMIDGVAWGFLLVLFILTLWGDLSQSYQSDKYYALGVMPFFISRLLENTVGSYILDNVMPSPEVSIVFYAALFSLTAFLLFLAILPLVYAPETLPEKVVKERELKIYVEQAQEIAQKYY